MVKASELRIGNLTEQGMIVGITATEVITIDGKHWAIEDIEPIPLTPERLERAGFEKVNSSNEFWTHWQLKTGWHISEAHHDEVSAGVKIGNYYWGDGYVEIKYFHRLQNLYYLLHDKELTLSP